MKKVNRNNVITIIGPTASGKSDLAIKLAKLFKGAIISADSRQIYQGLPIGTNQPIGKWQTPSNKLAKITGIKKILMANGTPHFFVNFLTPNKKYNVVKFQNEVYKLIPLLQKAGYLPIIVGGTGLYVSSIVEGYQFSNSQPNYKLRHKLEKLTLSQLQDKFRKLDPDNLRKIDLKNRRRVIRALESKTLHQNALLYDRRKSRRYNFLVLGLNPPRPKLYETINKRVDKMVRQGLLREVKWLNKKYPHSPALTTIGYQELVPVVTKHADLLSAVDLTKQHTRNFAKRQLTWFKRIPNVKWIKTHQAERIVKRYVKPQPRISNR